MPELPEVETVRRGLEPRLVGRRIVAVAQNRPDLRIPFPEDFATRLKGAEVAALRRRAKYLLADLSTGETLIIHLGMTGRVLIGEVALGRFAHAAGHGPHDHVVIDLDDATRLTYNDARRFGLMTLAPSDALEAHPLLAHLGPEPLSNRFSGAFLTEALARKRTPIKAALLDQTVVVGVGNIYACEALFRARISPRRLAASVAGVRAERLARAVREVLSDAIEAGGSSLRDYVQADGELGYFQHSFAVYDREGEACEACGATIRRIVQSNRSSFYCGRCQK